MKATTLGLAALLVACGGSYSSFSAPREMIIDGYDLHQCQTRKPVESDYHRENIIFDGREVLMSYSCMDICERIQNMDLTKTQGLREAGLALNELPELLAGGAEARITTPMHTRFVNFDPSNVTMAGALKHSQLQNDPLVMCQAAWVPLDYLRSLDER